MKTQILILFFAFFFPSPATAGGGGGGGSIVFDPTNYAKNVITSTRSVYAETQRATQIYNQLQQYQHMLAQAKNMDPTVLNNLLDRNTDDMRAMQVYIGGMSKLINDTDRLKEMALNRSVDWGSSGLSFADYAKRESERIKNGDRRRQQLAASELAVMENVNRDVDFVQAVQERIPGATANQSAEIMNSSLARVIAQNATIIQMQAANSASQKADIAAQEAKKQDLARTAADASRRDKEASRALIDRLLAAPGRPTP